MGYLLDIAPKELEKVLYFGGSYVIISVDGEKREADLPVLSEKVDEIKARYDVYAEDRVAAIRTMRAEVQRVLDGELDPEEFHGDAEPDDEFGFFNYFDIYETYRRIVVKSAQLGDDEIKGQRAKVDKLADDYVDRGLKAVDEAKTNIDRAWEQFKSIAPRDVVGDETLYLQMERMFGRDAGFEPESFGVYFNGGTGAEAVRELLTQVDLDAECAELEADRSTRRRVSARAGPSSACAWRPPSSAAATVRSG